MQISITVSGNVGNLPRIVDEAVQKIYEQVETRGPRAANALRSSALRVLGGQRSGRVYRKPHTKNETYVASAPGESPAVRSGILRRNWNIGVEGGRGGGVSIRPTIYSGARAGKEGKCYAFYLENGTPEMAPRPFREKIVEGAKPEVIRIYSEPYL